MGARYEQLAAHLRDRITDGTWPPGTRLPSSAELQRQHDLGRGAVELAVAQLRREGLIETRRGARPEVISPLPRLLLVDPREPWPYGREEMGRGTRMVRGELADRLCVPPRTRITRVVYECLGPDGRAAMLATVYQRGASEPRHESAATVVTCGEFASDEARALGVAGGTPALRIALTGFGPDLRPVMAADLVLRADRWGVRL